MTRLVRLLLVVLVMIGIVSAAGDAFAGGRAVCTGQVHFGLYWSARCAVEQTIITIPVGDAGELELAAGAYIDWHRSAIPYPYTALLWFARDWWAGLEIGKPVDHAGWYIALSGGIRW